MWSSRFPNLIQLTVKVSHSVVTRAWLLRLHSCAHIVLRFFSTEKQTNKNQTGNKSCDKGFIKWLSSCLIKTSKEILLLQMDQKEDLCPAFLRHGWISTKLLEHWGRVALLQHWNPTHYRGHLRLTDLDEAFWDGSSKWRVSTSYFPLNLASQLSSVNISEI